MNRHELIAKFFSTLFKKKEKKHYDDWSKMSGTFITMDSGDFTISAWNRWTEDKEDNMDFYRNRFNKVN